MGKINNIFKPSYITEYDIEKCDISVMLHLGLIDKDTYDVFNNMPKEKRVITIGNMKKTDRTLDGKIRACVKDIMDTLIKENDLDEEDIVEKAFDAIWVTKGLKKGLKFGNHVNIRCKRSFNCMLILDGAYYYLDTITGDRLIRHGKCTNESLSELIFDIMGFKMNSRDDISNMYLQIHEFRLKNKDNESMVKITNKIISIFL